VSFENTNAVLHVQLVWLSVVTPDSGHGEHCAAAVRENVLPLHVVHS
jgi:hypothetical protein